MSLDFEGVENHGISGIGSHYLQNLFIFGGNLQFNGNYSVLPFEVLQLHPDVFTLGE